MTDLQEELRNALPPNLPQSQTTNPFWDIVRTIPGNDIEWEYNHIWAPDCMASFLNSGTIIDRYKFCAEYTFAIPDPTSLQFVAEHLTPRAVEMGAGMGYWAWQLSQLGVDMIAYDCDPPYDGYNFYHNLDNEPGIKTHHPVQRGTPDVLTSHADRTLFLCWPPMSDMAIRCLDYYKGNRLVYIGEGNGGCTGDDAFHERLEQEWNEIASHRPVQWWGIHDCVTVFERPT